MARQYKELKLSFLKCRTYGHEWDDVSGLPGNRTVEYLRGIRITLRCARCATIRHEVWSSVTGECMARYYTYPDGYSTTRWDGKGTIKEAFRRELLARRKEIERKLEKVVD